MLYNYLFIEWWREGCLWMVGLVSGSAGNSWHKSIRYTNPATVSAPLATGQQRNTPGMQITASVGWTCRHGHIQAAFFHHGDPDIILELSLGSIRSSLSNIAQPCAGASTLACRLSWGHPGARQPEQLTTQQQKGAYAWENLKCDRYFYLTLNSSQVHNKMMCIPVTKCKKN